MDIKQSAKELSGLPFKIELCTMSDYAQIIKDICEFWGNDRTLNMHHPFLIHEFGNTAFVIKDADKVIAYLLGFFSQTESTAYVHLIAVREAYQKKGLGETLYNHFIKIARASEIKKIKAITTPSNRLSIDFHKNKIGMTLLGEPDHEGIHVVKNYSGENKDRVVFEKVI